MAKSVMIVLIATVAALTAPPVLAQSAAASATVAPVTVTARKPSNRWVPAQNPIPPELGAATEMCWQAAQDPAFEALLDTVGSEPNMILPTVYRPTRFPRNPDWAAPPVTPPGSPFPEVLSIKDYVLGKPGDPDRKLARAGKFLDCLHVTEGSPSMGRQMDRMANDVTGRVRAAASGGGLGGGGPITMGVNRSDGQSYAGNPLAQMNARDKTLPLGFALFDHGRYEEALTQFQAADRKLGSLEAQLMIGKIYLYGLREKSDPAEGVKWLRRAADARFVAATDIATFDPLEPQRNTPMGEAAMILADVYGKGMGPVAKDPAIARRYLERAYRVGHVAAAMALGDIYYYGVDTAPDPKRAFDYYMKGATFAYAPAAVAVAEMYDTGEAPGGRDRAKALAWYAQAAKIDHPQAFYALAVAFDRGDGVTANPQTALAFYKLAATQGDPAAQTAIGTFFYRGEAGLPHDPVLARKWFERAATAGDADGMFNLAAMQAKGEGGDLDRVKAWGWLKIADRLGHPGAGPAVRVVEARFTADDRAGVSALAAGGAG